jgi:hypothetical protein
VLASGWDGRLRSFFGPDQPQAWMNRESRLVRKQKNRFSSLVVYPLEFFLTSRLNSEMPCLVA